MGFASFLLYVFFLNFDVSVLQNIEGDKTFFIPYLTLINSTNHIHIFSNRVLKRVQKVWFKAWFHLHVGHLTPVFVLFSSNFTLINFLPASYLNSLLSNLSISNTTNTKSSNFSFPNFSFFESCFHKFKLLKKPTIVIE
jgi:hypothetical protein